MAAADYPAMLTLIEHGLLQPQRLIERTIGLHDAATLLPHFDRETVAGMTMVDPAR
jgi:alcohol dehydrogenase